MPETNTIGLGSVTPKNKMHFKKAITDTLFRISKSPPWPQGRSAQMNDVVEGSW